jgi:hypothetical protein
LDKGKGGLLHRGPPFSTPSYDGSRLSDEAASLALEEFEPILRDFIRPYKSELSLPLDIGLTPDQIAAIKEAHSECVQEIFQHYGHEMGMALATLAGVIGSKYRDNT